MVERNNVQGVSKSAEEYKGREHHNNARNHKHEVALCFLSFSQQRFYHLLQNQFPTHSVRGYHYKNHKHAYLHFPEREEKKY